jgi:putative PIN family toxin of toxin-antitoxin system
MPQTIPGVVFDCNVFWRAFFSRTGVGHECYRLIVEKKVIHFVSSTTVDELVAVLSRPETLSKFTDLDSDDVEEFVRYVVSISSLVRSVPHVFDLPRDVDDEPYIDLAIAADADYLVTSDRDLLDLMFGIDDASKEFRQRFRNIKVVRPDEFLRIIAETGLSLAP